MEKFGRKVRRHRSLMKINSSRERKGSALKDHLTPAHLKSDAAWRMALDDVPGDGDNPGIRHPDTGQGEVRHVQQGVPGDHVLPPPAVQVLGKESKNIFDRVYTNIFPIILFVFCLYFVCILLIICLI